MSNNVSQLDVNKIELDKTNPRISNFLEVFDESAIDSDTLALLLGTSSDSCASLRESIRENGGLINPIIVNKISDDNYVVIEGNTRLQIYRDFLKSNIEGEWDSIDAIIHDDLEPDDIHAIRLQAHLVGPREWDPYSKAKYLCYLANEEHMPMSELIAFCGGTSKASEIKHMIAAYQDMQDYYRPLCDDDTWFDIKKFHGFVELQNKNILDALTLHGFSKKDFSQWMIDDRFSTLQDVRQLPNIFNSQKATTVFLKENTREAKKILAAEEISLNSLKDVPYDLLAKELTKRMYDFKISEVQLLKNDLDYADKVSALRDVVENVQLILDEVDDI